MEYITIQYNNNTCVCATGDAIVRGEKCSEIREWGISYPVSDSSMELCVLEDGGGGGGWGG